MGVKLQINSLEALERLIGGDSDIEIEIRNSVVQNFTNKYLKVLAGEIKTDAVQKAMRHELQEQELINIRSNTFGSRGRKIVHEKLKSYFNYELSEAIEKHLNESPLTVRLNERLEQCVNNSVASLTDESLTRRIDRMVDARLKEKLGIDNSK